MSRPPPDTWLQSPAKHGMFSILSVLHLSYCLSACRDATDNASTSKLAENLTRRMAWCAGMNVLAQMPEIHLIDF